MSLGLQVSAPCDRNSVHCSLHSFLNDHSTVSAPSQRLTVSERTPLILEATHRRPCQCCQSPIVAHATQSFGCIVHCRLTSTPIADSSFHCPAADAKHHEQRLPTHAVVNGAFLTWWPTCRLLVVIPTAVCNGCAACSHSCSCCSCTCICSCSCLSFLLLLLLHLLLVLALFLILLLFLPGSVFAGAKTPAGALSPSHCELLRYP